MNHPEEWFYDVPPITRTFVTAAVLTSLAVVGIIIPEDSSSHHSKSTSSVLFNSISTLTLPFQISSTGD